MRIRWIGGKALLGALVAGSFAASLLASHVWAAEIEQLRRASVPYYTGESERQPAGTISDAELGEERAVLREHGRRVLVELLDKRQVWLRAMDVKLVDDRALPPCPEQVAGSGAEGTAVSRGMSRGCR